MRIASYNLLHGLRVFGAQPPTAGTYDRAALQGAVAALDADILGLQEVDVWQERTERDHQVALAAEALEAAQWRFAPSVCGTPGDPDQPWTSPSDIHVAAANEVWTEGSRSSVSSTLGTLQSNPALYGVGLISRYPVRHWRATTFRAAPFSLPLMVPATPRARFVRIPDEPRAVLAAVVETPTGLVSVVTGHLSFVPGFNVSQLRKIRTWVADLPRPLFLFGDFNLPGALPARVTGWSQLLRAPTYPVMNPRVQFDHLLADGFSGDVADQRVQQLPVSDHAAISVDVSLPNMQLPTGGAARSGE